MFALLKPLFVDPRLNARLFAGSLLIHLLALASAFYAILVFNRYLSHGLDSTLITLTFGAVLAMVFEAALRRLRFRMVGALCARRERQLAEAAAARLLGAPVGALQGLDAATRAAPTRAIDQLALALTPANTLALLDVPFALIFLLVLVLMAWPLGLIAGLFALATLAWAYLHGVGLREANGEQQKAHLDHATTMASAERLDTVRICNAAPALRQRAAATAGRLRLARHGVGARQDRLQSAIQSIAALLSIATIGAGAKLVIAGAIDYGSLFGASILATRMLALISRPAHSASLLLQGAQALRVVETFLKLPSENEGGSEPGRYEGRLELKDLAFGYPGGTAPLFENLSLRLDAGRLLVVTGANGAGKTSFARLVAGLVEPTRGGLYADGVDLRQLNPGWWRKQLVYLPQEPELIDGTLRDNLTALTPAAPEDWLQHLLGVVGLKAVVDRHPLGLKMPVTQGGRNLSLGIRRRVALARALTSEGRLVLIDEPSEGFDAAGNQMMSNLLSELLREGRTVILMTQSPGDLGRQGIVVDLDVKPVPTVREPATASTLPAR